jgi:hypothetical protein
MSERPDLVGDSSLAGIIALLGFVLVATAQVTAAYPPATDPIQGVRRVREWQKLAHRDISRRRNNSVVFGAKRTFGGPRLQNRIYEYAP